jgi:2-keto-4-pentenoate hydratase/2-oxohepta-3-ene-1,7-dioic acid hydratase in catechol pathway
MQPPTRKIAFRCEHMGITNVEHLFEHVKRERGQLDLLVNGNLQLQLRLNGELKQKENTDRFIDDVPTVVSFISQYITLHPGDLIVTGAPGATSAIKPSDVVEVKLEGVGVFRNSVVAEK